MNCTSCHSPHGECGLKYESAVRQRPARCHSPHGECGLKYAEVGERFVPVLSLPAWGVRVEIEVHQRGSRVSACHSPHGECGLKSACFVEREHVNESLPAWGVRVEMGRCRALPYHARSLPAWGVRVEIRSATERAYPAWSLPAWGVRVEINVHDWSDSHGTGHSPHGECGLKLPPFERVVDGVHVTPRMGSAG